MPETLDEGTTTTISDGGTETTISDGGTETTDGRFNLEYEGPAPKLAVVPGSERNALWIVINGQQTLNSNVAPGGYAQLRLIPSMDGQCILNEIYPNGQLVTSAGNQITAGGMYRMGFIGDMQGTHTLWYTINGVPSNQIQIIVEEGRGSRPGGGSGSGGVCSVWTDKRTYNVGEMVTIYYSLSNGCTAQMTVRGPQGISASYGPNYVPATTRTKIGQAWYPVGMRTVTLQTWGGMTCTSSCSYNVVEGYTPENNVLSYSQGVGGIVREI